LRVARLEVEILKRVAAYFAQENVLPNEALLIYTFIAECCSDLAVSVTYRSASTGTVRRRHCGRLSTIEPP
jgi:hypothetical protein